MRRAVWDPLALKLDGAERIFIVPDGTLHLVSFGALPVGRTSYLVEHGPVLHLLSAERELVREPATQRGDGILALGGASFGRLPGSVSRPATTHERAPCEDFRTHEFEPLPGSEEEVKRIAKIWGDRSDVALVTGAQATEAAFRSLAPGREVVHVASHGFFFRDSCEPGSGSTGTRGIGGVVSPAARPSRRPPRDNPLRLSGIAMAGANRRGQTAEGTDDGILTAEEIASVDLSRVSWVVLSACDTGLGEIQSGEGVLGLRRAFQIAGAGTLVMSLWAVEDKSALEWMADLYAYRVRHGLGTSDAIREASRNRLQARRKEGRGTHPYFWAGFVAAGAWD
ncbi:MAG TPA: CHAT domain-containing protein [Candidatus Eisenbacteria bacterium]|nr:CHAT domain-containing protein [Candidatus Eisenbacteria bacterium]